jgi:hypothetical protein
LATGSPRTKMWGRLLRMLSDISSVRFFDISIDRVDCRSAHSNKTRRPLQSKASGRADEPHRGDTCSSRSVIAHFL